MRIPFQNLSPKTKFILLQVAALASAFGAMPILLDHLGLRIWTAVFCVGGASLAIVGLVRCGLNGQSEWRVLGSCLLAYLGSLLCWTAIAILLSPFLRIYSLVALIYTQAPVFTACSLVYFGLGPFRPQVSTGQVVRRLVARRDDLRVGSPARSEVVAKAEERLGLRLPTSFREFLLDFGEVRGHSITFLGLGPTTDLNHPSTDDFVGATLDGRERLGLPQGYVLCSVDSEGRMACLDTTAIKDGEAQVVLWSPDTRGVIGIAGLSFDRHLIKTLRSRTRPW